MVAHWVIDPLALSISDRGYLHATLVIWPHGFHITVTQGFSVSALVNITCTVSGDGLEPNAHDEIDKCDLINKLHPLINLMHLGCQVW